VKQIAQDLQDGKHIVIHCVGGIGRTGTLATSVLIALGQPVRAALDCIESTGSHPETGIQRDLVYWIANQFSQK
jgi:protein-tyrosine phosphatase